MSVLKILIGNVVFFGIITGWFCYTDNDRTLLLPGVVLAFSAFLCGIVMGYVLHTPPARRKAPLAHVRTAPAYIAAGPGGRIVPPMPAIPAEESNQHGMVNEVKIDPGSVDEELAESGVAPTHESDPEFDDTTEEAEGNMPAASAAENQTGSADAADTAVVRAESHGIS